jgi:hypothetical protein
VTLRYPVDGHSHLPHPSIFGKKIRDLNHLLVELEDDDLLEDLAPALVVLFAVMATIASTDPNILDDALGMHHTRGCTNKCRH